MESLEALKKQLLTIYKSDGFKSLIKRHEFAPQLAADKAAAAKPNLDITRIVEQLKTSVPQPEETKVDLVVSTTQKHMATLIKLNSLHKRVHFIQHYVGDWKPTPKYKNIAAQIEHVQKLLELVDQSRITYYQKRVETLLGELETMHGP
jgi:hypothetical protein